MLLGCGGSDCGVGGGGFRHTHTSLDASQTPASDCHLGGCDFSRVGGHAGKSAGGTVRRTNCYQGDTTAVSKRLVSLFVIPAKGSVAELL